MRTTKVGIYLNNANALSTVSFCHIHLCSQRGDSMIFAKS